MDDHISAAIHQANDALRLAEAGHIEEAIRLFRRLIQAQPAMVGARNNLGALLNRAGQSEEAIEVFKEALRLKPDFAEAWNNLGNALFHTTRTQAAGEAYARAVRIKPDYFEAHSNRCLMPLYRTQSAGASEQEAFSHWRRACAALGSEAANATEKVPPGTPIRVGLLSPDFRVHSVAYFLLPILRRWSQRPDLAITLYSDVAKPDHLTDQFRSLPVAYHSVAQLSHQALRGKIRKDGMHVLLELCGHFSGNRLPVFAARTAPCQIAWLGYPASSGTPNIDYRVSDAVVYPEEPAADCHESILRLKSGYHCYSPPAKAPAVGPAPASTGRPFTFGCCNNAFKIAPEIARSWGRILEKNPGTRCLLKAKSFANPVVRTQIRKWIHPDARIQDRVEFRGRQASLHDHLDTYNAIDLTLDTFPYNGTTTTCESLWMGVPCLSLSGAEPQSRVGASLLRQAGLDHFAATSFQHYEALATYFAQSPGELKRYRSSLRAHLVKTPLMNPAAVADELIEEIRRCLQSGIQNCLQRPHHPFRAVAKGIDLTLERDPLP